MKGTWDSIHVVEVQEGKKTAHYKLTSTVMLSIETETEATGTVTLSGNLTRQVDSSIRFFKRITIIISFFFQFSSKKLTPQLLMPVLMFATLVEWLKIWKLK